MRRWLRHFSGMDGTLVVSDTNALRERILETTLRGALIAGFIAYIPSVYLAARERLWDVVATDTVGYAWVVVLVFAKGWSFRSRAIHLVALLYSLSVALLLSLGPIGAGNLWLLACSMMAALLLGIRAALVSVGVVASTVVAVTVFDVVVRPVWLGASPLAPAVLWLVIDANMVGINVTVSLSLAVLVRGLEGEIGRRRVLEQERLRLARVVEQAVELVAITDVEGRVEYVNPAFTRATGIALGLARGRALREIGVLGGGGEHADQAWEELRQGRVWSGRAQNRRRDGSFYDAEVSLSPVRDDAGEVAYAVAVMRDVTRERELQQHLQRAQKLEAVGTLASGIAHDFNNILVPIVANAELVRDGLDPASPYHADLDEVIKAGDRAAALVQRLLTFSRQLNAERRPVLLGPLLSETAKLLRASLPTSIDIQVHVGRGDLVAVAEPAEVQQIVVNLCTNAAHAMAARAGTLSISLEGVEPGRLPRAAPPGLSETTRYARLEVEDTGCGIPPEHLERIFDPFFTTKAPGEGTGLGLAMVHTIAGALGGGVTVHSEVGAGSRFAVYLPAALGEAPKAGATDLLAPAGNGTRVIVVDDEPAVRSVIAQFLRRWDFDVRAAETPEEALALLADEDARPAVLLTDYTMPRMTGAELAAAARELVPTLYVAVMSGVFNKDREQRLETVGVDGVLAKPFSAASLAAVMRRALAQLAGSPADPATSTAAGPDAR